MNVSEKKVFGITATVFVLVLIGISIVLILLGNAYKSRISSVPKTTPKELRLVKQKQVKKITVRGLLDDSCLEISPDGVVRRYRICKERLEDANRLTNLRDISHLFRLVTEKDLSMYRNPREGSSIELIIETDEGIEYVYLPTGGGVVPEEIIDTIEKIKEDIPPIPSATVMPTSSPTSMVSPSPTPSLGPNITPTPTPTPTSGGGGTQPFTCEFTESGGKKKPVTVNDVVCSTDPV